MHFEGMNLNLLVALDALLEEKSVTRAATRLHVSQPAMSAALQNLRYHFSDELLERFGRNLELTPRAKNLAVPLRELLIDIRAALDATPKFDPATSRRSFRLAMSSFVAELLLPALARALADQAPNLSLEVQYLTSDVFTRLNNGVLDLCITVPDRAYFDPSYVQDEFVSEHLFSDPFVLVADSGNDRVHEGMNHAELCAHPLAVVRVGENVRSVVERAIDRFPNKPNIICTLPSYMLALRMVSDSRLVSIVRSKVATEYATDLGLKIVSSPLDLPVLEDALIWQGRTDRDPGQTWLRELIRATVAN